MVCSFAILLHIQNASYHWPTVSGKIVQSERVFVDGGRDSHYRADMSYSYQVNGKKYTSDRISLWSRNLSSYDSINGVFVKNHPPGTSVDVYYEPTRPEHAVLIPGPDETFIKFEMSGGALMMIVAIPLIIREMRRRRRLTVLLNAPDAATRTIQLRASDVEKGMIAYGLYVPLTLLCIVPAMILLASPWMADPAVLMEKVQPAKRGLIIWGIGCALAFLFFLMRGTKKGRSAECPLCRCFFNKTIFSTRICPDCKTRIVFEDKTPPA